MKVLLSCHRVQFPMGEKWLPVVEELVRIGFRFACRAVPNGSLAYAIEPVEVELGSVEDLIELQRRIGLPLRVEDGCLEVET